MILVTFWGYLGATRNNRRSDTSAKHRRSCAAALSAPATSPVLLPRAGCRKPALRHHPPGAGQSCAGRNGLWRALHSAITSLTEKPVPVPKLNTRLPLPSQQPFEALYVGIDQIHHMDVIAGAGAVRRGIIRAVDGQGIPFASGGFDHRRDQMGFWLVPFTDFGFNVGARNVEIPRIPPPQARGSRQSRAGSLRPLALTRRRR